MEDRRLTVLYGSQTGTAQDLAEQVWRESKRYHFRGSVMAMDSYDIQTFIREQIVVLVCSTTGNGDEPDNMKQFWKFLLRKSLPTNSLNGVHFAVLGLGDSSYSKFNFVAKRLNKRLQQLGGNMILPLGLGDDQHDLGVSAVTMPWMRTLWENLLNLCPLPSELSVLDESPRQFRWSVVEVSGDGVSPDIPKKDIFEDCTDAVFDKPFYVEVINNVRTTAPDHFQDVRLISLSCRNVQWAPGDVLLVRPQNLPERVDELFSILAEHNFSFNADTLVQLNEFDAEMPVPKYFQKIMSLRTIATQIWDINAIPRPRTFEMLAKNCKNELEREKLIEFTTPEGQEDLYSYANRPRRTILEVLRDFPHSTSQLNLSILFEIFQSIKPRAFSIASCHESGTLEILVAIVSYKTIISRPREGLCSNWLKGLTPGNRIRGVIKKGTFKFPKDVTIPILMVGPGTGLAPFRSKLLERELMANVGDSQVFSNTLFFGCRGENADYHCKDDLIRMQAKKFLQLFTAFSRDQEDKIYVQHRIKDQHNHLRNKILENEGYFFVAGNSKNMPASVKEALISALNSEEYVENMIQSGRYQEETWA